MISKSTTLSLSLLALLLVWVPSGKGKEEYVQTPRPMKENMKEAYRATWGGIWNSRRPVARTRPSVSALAMKNPPKHSVVVLNPSLFLESQHTNAENDTIAPDDNRLTASQPLA